MSRRWIDYQPVARNFCRWVCHLPTKVVTLSLCGPFFLGSKVCREPTASEEGD